jgi:hypothetical protein
MLRPAGVDPFNQWEIWNWAQQSKTLSGILRAKIDQTDMYCDGTLLGEVK